MSPQPGPGFIIQAHNIKHTKPQAAQPRETKLHLDGEKVRDNDRHDVNDGKLVKHVGQQSKPGYQNAENKKAEMRQQ